MTLDYSDPLFRTFALAATAMIAKTFGMAWMTVWKMQTLRTGFRAPEDLRATALNPAPRPDQLAPDERVERWRRIHHNDLENIPFFLAGGFLYVLTDPALIQAQIVLYGYVVTRLMHLWAYASARTHDLRATFWTLGQILMLWMLGAVVLAAV